MKSKFLKYKWYMAIIGLILLNFVRQGYLNHMLDHKEIIIKSNTVTQDNNNEQKQLKQEEIEQVEIGIEQEKNQELKQIPVYICGAIKNPGVYYVLENSIINDVVKQSGGLTADADSMAINLASPIKENSKIVIPSQGEEIDKLSDLYENSRETKDVVPVDIVSQNQLINLNTATKEELMSLNGIGEVKANDIINYRTEKNNFQSIEEIKQISGIGEKIFEKIKSFITV